MTNLQYTFMCKDEGLSDTQAKAVIEAQTNFKLVDSFSKTFLVETKQSAADAFAATNASWQVFPAVKYKLPNARFKVIKPPSQE